MARGSLCERRQQGGLQDMGEGREGGREGEKEIEIKLGIEKGGKLYGREREKE